MVICLYPKSCKIGNLDRSCHNELERCNQYAKDDVRVYVVNSFLDEIDEILQREVDCSNMRAKQKSKILNGLESIFGNKEVLFEYAKSKNINKIMGCIETEIDKSMGFFKAYDMQIKDITEDIGFVLREWAPVFQRFIQQ